MGSVPGHGGSVSLESHLDVTLSLSLDGGTGKTLKRL